MEEHDMMKDSFGSSGHDSSRDIDLSVWDKSDVSLELKESTSHIPEDQCSIHSEPINSVRVYQDESSLEGVDMVQTIDMSSHHILAEQDKSQDHGSSPTITITLIQREDKPSNFSVVNNLRLANDENYSKMIQFLSRWYDSTTVESLISDIRRGGIEHFVSHGLCRGSSRRSRNSKSNKTRSVYSCQLTKCPDSDRIFDGTRLMLRHMLKAHLFGWKPISCDKCEYQCYFRIELNRHEVTHTKNGILKCYQCSYTTNLKYSYERHVNSHTRSTTFKCDWKDCDKTFMDMRNLRDHKNGHTGKTPHQCDICQEKFRWAAGLRKHAKTHNSPRLSCADCSYSTKSLVNLRKHKEKVHPCVTH